MSCNSCPVKRKKKSSCPKKKSKKSRCPACGRSVCRCCPTTSRRRTKTSNTRGARFGSTGRMPSAPIPFYYPQVRSAPQSQFMRVGQPTDGFVANMPVSANNKIAARQFFSQGVQVGVRIPAENLTAGEATNTIPIQQGTHEPIHVEPLSRTPASDMMGNFFDISRSSAETVPEVQIPDVPVPLEDPYGLGAVSGDDIDDNFEDFSEAVEPSPQGNNIRPSKITFEETGQHSGDRQIVASEGTVTPLLPEAKRARHSDRPRGNRPSSATRNLFRSKNAPATF